MATNVFARERTAAEALSSRLISYQQAPVGIILGTGLGQWVESLHDFLAIDYKQIPGFPKATVESHVGRFCAGRVRNVPVLALQGRFHLYEGYTPDEVCFGLRTLGLLGVKKIIITNAAGALNPLCQPGEIMVISDQINLTGRNPLVGLNYGEPLFPDMSQLFSPRLAALAHSTALQLGQRLQDGVYIGILGPSLETPAETRMFRRLGADAIGMSTVLETIAAKQMGMEIIGLSCLTNKNLPDCMAPTSLEEIISVGKDISARLSSLLDELIPRI
ncbi:purine-nucleoside phosphorylase [Desulfonatronum sp. SC1]|uniref:purine-nucleoside phosphorylase n=1 Tax=Desulfonatronum sp. SC1 TaxID=2109626 RepID=UPI000D2F8C50|nr:purine-nucleoside phosphorylase [Desulfonatronum sp. SC1]PTN33451.1 purine-nucleoside phosphorylase [Desulfonatronum sp. SC1]